jgi:putative DNA primase/helicase
VAGEAGWGCAPGSGKSFFVADLVAHVSAPHKTHWRDKKSITGGVAYCFLEGGLGAQNRIAAIKQNIGDLGCFFSYPDSMNLSSAPLLPDESRPRVAECDAKRLVASILTQQGEVSVVVVDTFSRAMSGKDENSSTEMTSFIAAMDYIAKELDYLVIVVHHSGKDQSRGARGHSSLLGAIDTEIEITRPNKELPGRIAKLTKMKEGADGHEFAFDLEKVTLGFDEDGEEVTTCIVVSAELDLTESSRNKPYGPNEKVVLNAFETFLADHTDKYTPYGTGFPDRPERCVDLEAFKEFAVQRLPDSGKNNARRVRDAVASLTDRGMLVINGGLLWRVR